MNYIDTVTAVDDANNAKGLLRIGLQFFGDASGAKAQDNAEPVDTAANEGAEERDAAGSADDVNDDIDDIFDADDDTDNDNADDDKGKNGSDGGTTAQDKTISSAEAERDKIYAEARRTAEKNATAKADAFAKKQIDDIIVSMAITDPYTGKVISTKAEYDAYKNRHASEVISTELGKAGISKEAINNLISQHPAIQKANAAAEAFSQEQQRIQREKADETLKSELAEISKLDGEIKSFADLRKLPEYEQITNLVKQGSKISDAYKLVYFDKLTSNAGQRAAQQVRNEVTGKAHMQPVSQRGHGGVVVPAKVAAVMRDLDPDISDADIKKAYERDLRSTKLF